MALFDVEALLDETAKDVKMDDAPPPQSATTANGDESHPSSNGKDEPSSSSGDRRRSRDRGGDRDNKDRDRDRSRDRKRRDRSRDAHYSSRRGSPDTPRSEAGSHRSTRRRSRSRDDHRDRHSRRGRGGGGGDGDYYRGGVRGGGRSRSRSPGGRFYRPRDDRRDYRDRRDRRGGGGDDDHRRGGGGGRTPRADRPEREKTPPALTEDERDRRTVFVQQLAARLRTRDLKEFFEKVGAVSEAQIVKDRVSNRSKGYVAPLLFPPYSPRFPGYSLLTCLILVLATWNLRRRNPSLVLFSLLAKSS